MTPENRPAGKASKKTTPKKTKEKKAATPKKTTPKKPTTKKAAKKAVTPQPKKTKSTASKTKTTASKSDGGKAQKITRQKISSPEPTPSSSASVRSGGKAAYKSTDTSAKLEQKQVATKKRNRGSCLKTLLWLAFIALIIFLVFKYVI